MPSLSDAVPLRSDLFDLYTFYKARTATVVKWLTTHSKVPCNSVNDLTTAAKSIVRKHMKSPDELYSDLKDALRSRMEIARYYEKAYRAAQVCSDERLKRHEYFSNTLSGILQLLFPRQDILPSLSPLTSQVVTRQVIADIITSNNYSVLEARDGLEVSKREYGVGEALRRDGENIEDGWHVTEKAVHEEHGPKPLNDDLLALDLEFLSYLFEFDTAAETVKQFWANAGSSASDILIAAFLTNAAYELMDKMTVKAKETLAIPSHEAFLLKLRACGPLNDSYLRANPSEEHIDRVFSKGRGFSAPFDALEDFVATHKRGNPSWDSNVEFQILRPQVFEDARVLVPGTSSASPGSEHMRRESTCYLAYVRSMHERLLLYCKARISRFKECQTMDAGQLRVFKLDMFPLMHHFNQHILGGHYKHDTSLIYGLQLQPEIFRSFRPRGQTVNSRALVLKFVKEIQHALRPLIQMAQPNPRTLDFLRQYLLELTEFNSLCEDFVAEGRWDLYHQSPWTAGSNMITFSVKAIQLGMGLCCTGGVLGAVLHLYHCLRYMKIQEPVLLFDHLVEVLNGPCFPGGLPKSHFCSNFLRFLGGKIDFARTGVRHESLLADKALRLDYPKKLPLESDEDSRLNPEKWSVLYAFDVNFYRFDNNDCKRFLLREQITRKIQGTKVMNTMDSVRFHDLLMNLRSALGKEFLSKLPLAKINWFAVYVTCRQVLETCIRTSNAQILKDVGVCDKDPFVHFEEKAVTIVGYALHKMDFLQTLPRNNHLSQHVRNFDTRAALVAFQSVQDGGNLSKCIKITFKASI